MKNLESIVLVFSITIYFRLSFCEIKSSVEEKVGFEFRNKTVAFSSIVDKGNPSARKQLEKGSRRAPIRRSDLEHFHYSPFKSSRLQSSWIEGPFSNSSSGKSRVRKEDASSSWPLWVSKKEISTPHRKHRKYIDALEDYLGLDSKHHDSSDRKYIHEHEGFFFPIHVPSHHHEKDDHLIPLLLLLLLPLLLFAIIIPLNANLLSTLFLIMQNNGATTTAAQLAAATGRRRRDLDNAPHPFVEARMSELLQILDVLTEGFPALRRHPSKLRLRYY